LEHALRRFGGAARTRELRAEGVTRGELANALASGELVRHGRGCLAWRGAPHAFVAAARAGGVVTCVSALEALGLPLLDAAGAPHVALDVHRGAPRPGLLPSSTVLHWTPRLEARRPGVPVADAATVLTHAARCLPEREAVAAVDAALHRGLVTVARLVEARLAVGGPRLDRVLALADGKAESIQESLARVALLRAGLRVRSQVVLDGVGRVDLLVEECVVVELDGFAYHGDRLRFREDRRRDRALVGRGLSVLRFTFEDVVHGPDRLVQDVRSAVSASGGPTPEPSVRRDGGAAGRSRGRSGRPAQTSAPTVG
jgi:very-short-patch-repair endonuclease